LWAIGEQFECEAPLLKKLSTQKASAPIVLNFDPDIVVIDALLNRVLVCSVTSSSASVVSQKLTRINDRDCSSQWHLTYHLSVQACLLAEICEILDVCDRGARIAKSASR